jgi:hypothetical protein
MSRILIISFLIFSAGVKGQDTDFCHEYDEYQKKIGKGDWDIKKSMIFYNACERQKQERQKNNPNQTNTQALNINNSENTEDNLVNNQNTTPTGTLTQKCNKILAITPTPPASASPEYKKCQDLQALSKAAGNGDLVDVKPRDWAKSSMDQQITCTKKASYTIDYDKCVKIIGLYNAVLLAEQAMDLQQKTRTNLKHQSIQAETAKQAADGNLQQAALDATKANHQHMEDMSAEKLAAYSASVTALVLGYRSLPSEKDAIKACGSQNCELTVKNNKSMILANEHNKAPLATAIGKFSAKATAAGIAWNQHKKAANTVEQIKQAMAGDGGEDLMIELCQFNPADPACAKKGERVSGTSSFTAGDFSIGSGGGNNSFDMNPSDGKFGEPGTESNLSDANHVADVNSPFKEEADKARGIINPAGAAQIQAAGGGGPGGGGGAGGGLGGGGSSLGSDLDAANKDGDKEAQIKTTKVSDSYSSAGGGGYKAIARSKDDSNPFASLFDKKSAAGGIEEDRSIASGDIDGKGSPGIFQKISKRYNQVYADKRIEAMNLVE